MNRTLKRGKPGNFNCFFFYTFDSLLLAIDDSSKSKEQRNRFELRQATFQRPQPLARRRAIRECTFHNEQREKVGRRKGLDMTLTVKFSFFYTFVSFFFSSLLLSSLFFKVFERRTKISTHTRTMDIINQCPYTSWQKVDIKICSCGNCSVIIA